MCCLVLYFFFFFFKQKTAYEMRISDWSSDVCSSDLVADIVAEIAAASREQSTGLEQINTAVGSMDEMTQRNGALVEETSAAAQSLANQAGELAALVQRYRISNTDRPVQKIGRAHI